MYLGLKMSFRTLLLLAASAMKAFAAYKNEPVQRIREAARVFTEIQSAKDKGIPDALLSKANGIIIVPGLKRAGFVVGGQYGKGVFVARLPNGKWSAPSQFGSKAAVSDFKLVLE